MCRLTAKYNFPYLKNTVRASQFLDKERLKSTTNLLNVFHFYKAI